MKKFSFNVIIAMLMAAPFLCHARDHIKLETTIIKGNKEMPQIVYIIPWKTMKGNNLKTQKLVLHSLFGNLFNPVHAADTRQTVSKISKHSDALTKSH